MKKKKILFYLILAFFILNVSGVKAFNDEIYISNIQNEKASSIINYNLVNFNPFLAKKDSKSDSEGTIKIGFDCEDPSIHSLMTLIKKGYNLIRIAVPLLLVIMGGIDFFKATMATKEEEIQKHKKRFWSRLLLGIIIFLLLSVFQLITSILTTSGVADSDSWLSCWNSL